MERHGHRLGTHQALTAMTDVARMLASKESARFAVCAMLMTSLR